MENFIFSFVDTFFRFIFSLQLKIINNLKFFEKLKKYNKIYSFFFIISYIILIKYQISIKFIIFYFFIGYIINLFINIVSFMSSFRKVFKEWLMLIFFIPTFLTILIIPENLTTFTLIQNLIFLTLFFIWLGIIVSFLSIKIVILVNSIYVMLLTFIQEMIKLSLSSLNNKFQILIPAEYVDFLFKGVIFILGIITIFSIIKEYWNYKYNNGIDILDLLKKEIVNNEIS